MAEVIHGDGNANQLNARADKTQVYGLKGNDTLTSDGKRDVLLVGGSGNDSLIMSGGNGTLAGGDGSDTFELTYSADKKLSAIIEDLDPVNDKIIVNYDGDTVPQLSSSISGNDVVLRDGERLSVTLKGVRDNDYFDGTLDDEAWEVLKLTNAEREAQGLSPLTMADGLTKGAQIRAEEITYKGKLGLLTDHTRRDNETSWRTVFDEIGKSYTDVGENLDGGARSPEDVVHDWMTSKTGHREILLGDTYKKLGVGYNEDDPDPTDHRFYWTQWFAAGLSSTEKVTVNTADLLSADRKINTVSKFIQGDDNANNIENSEYGATIDALGGGDTVTNSGLNVSISGGADNDSIQNSGSFTTINAGTGNDVIQLGVRSEEVVVEYAAGDGNDSISGFNSTDTIKIADIEYTPEIVGNDIILTVGDDSITFLGSASIAYDFLSYIDGYWSGLIVINDNNYQHTFENNMAGVTLQARSGNNTISNGLDGHYVGIESGNGDDDILNNGTLVTIDSGGGNDTIENYGGNLVYINSGTGNDTIANALGSYVIIDGGDGNDSINNQNLSGDSTLLGGAGSDRLENKSANALTDGGTGNDTIINWNDGTGSTLLGDTGNDFISNFAASVTIAGGAGNESISNNGDNVTIDAGEDNDQIIIYSGSNVSVHGGADNDLIVLNPEAQNVRIQYTEGDGNDTIRGFSSAARLRIGDGNGTYSATTIGSNVVLNIGKDKIVLEDAANLSVVNLVEGVACESPGEPDTIYLSDDELDYSNALDNLIIRVEDDDLDYSIANAGSNVSIVPGDSYNTISNSGNNVVIYGFNDGGNTITNTGDNVGISGNFGDDSITNSGNNVDIRNLFGLDVVNNSGNNVVINGSYENDSIVNSGSNVSIYGTTGTDTIELSSDAQNVLVGYGTGNMLVKGFNETDTLLLYELDRGYSIQTVGSDIVYKFVDNGYVSIEGAATLPSSVKIIAQWAYDDEYESDSIIFGEGDDSYVSSIDGAMIQALGGNDTIFNVDCDSVQIDLGAGEDFIISRGNKILINGGADDDTIAITYGFGLTIDGGDGNDYIYNGDDSNTILGGDGNDTIESYGNFQEIDGGTGDDSIVNRGDYSLVDLGAGNDEIDNYGNSVTINGETGNNDIHNYGDSAVIYSVDGDDTIWNGGDDATINTGAGNDSVFSNAANISIDLGTGKDFLHIRGDYASILMGDDDDTVKTDASNVTISGGAGNDRISLESGAANDLILYTEGDGNDTIWGLDENSRLQIGDGTASYSSTVQGDDLILTVGENTITLKDARDKPKHIIIGESGPSGGGSNDNGNDGGNDNSSGGRGDGSGIGSGIGGNTSGGTSSNEGNSSAASGGRSATGSAGRSASTGISGGNSLRRNSHSTTDNASTVTTSTETTNPLATSSTANQLLTPNSSLQTVYTGGNQVINDYASGERIVFGATYTGAFFDGNGNFFAGSTTGALVVQNAADKVIDLTDAAGNDFVKAYQATTAGVIDGRGLGGFEVINGSAGSDAIYAGDGGSQLWGGADSVSDAMMGGSGTDIFIGGKNQGADFFLNASANDVIHLNDSTLGDIVATAEENGTIGIAFNTGNVVAVQSSELLSANLMLADGSTYRFNHATKNWQTA